MNKTLLLNIKCDSPHHPKRSKRSPGVHQATSGQHPAIPPHILLRRTLWGFSLMFALILGSDSLWANSNEKWQCLITDQKNQQWVGVGDYQLSAINHGLDLCKKQSNQPSSFKSKDDDCESFINGISTRPMWSCSALDQMAKQWKSDFYIHRDDAALAAKAYCQNKSLFPDTCYINLMTCKNFNLKD